MKSFIGTGQGAPKDAVKKALQGLMSPSAILFMAPYEKAQEIAEQIREAFPQTPSVGTTGKTFVNGQVSEDTLAVLAFFEDAKVSCGMITQISKCPVACAGEIQKKLAEVSPGSDNTACIEFCTGSEEKVVTTLNSCIGKRNVPLMGGTVFGFPDGKTGAVYYNGKKYEDACVYAFIKNLTGKLKVYKENIYVKTSKQAHFATKVDVSRKALIELDGRPAAEVYSKELGIARDKIIDNVLSNPMGRAVGEQVFISSMLALEPNGTLLNYKRINKNDCIYFLSLGDYREIERRQREKIRQDMKRISLVLSVDCAYRHELYNKEGYTPTYVKDMAALGSHMGIVVGGEQYNNQHANQTMVCAVFE